MSGVSFRYSEAGVRKVRRVQFGILGPEELKASSVCNIVTDRTFENGKPIPGGLMDPALGAIDRLLNFASCGMDSFDHRASSKNSRPGGRRAARPPERLPGRPPASPTAHPPAVRV